MPMKCGPPGLPLDEDGPAPFKKSGTGLEFSSSDCLSAPGTSSDSDGSFVDVKHPRDTEASTSSAHGGGSAATAVAATARAAAAALEAVAKAGSSALFAAARGGGPAGLFAQFSGQGVDYLDELRTTYAASPAARPLLNVAAAALKIEGALAAAMEGGAKLLRYGLDVAAWVDQGAADAAGAAGTTPPLAYLRSAPISYPLIALTQLCSYVAALSGAGCEQGEMGQLLKGAAGHSQGVAAAVTVAWAEDDAALQRKAVLMVRYLFWHGFRMQQVFEEAQLSHAARASGGEAAGRGKLGKFEGKGEGTGPPMLAVVGLSPERLQQYLDSFNAALRGNGAAVATTVTAGRTAVGSGAAEAAEMPPVQLALVNGTTACTVCGLPRAIHALRSALLRDFVVGSAAVAAQASLPFYKRRPRLAAVRAVGVSAPFHAAALMGEAHERIMVDVARLGLRIPASELRHAVYSTAGGGADLRQAELDADDDVLAALVRMQVSQPVNWPAATRNMSQREGVTHVLDFGPGGAAGAAGLSARLLRERGEGGVVTLLATTSQLEDVPPDGTRPGFGGLNQLLQREPRAVHFGAATPRAAAAAAAAAVDFWGVSNVVAMSVASLSDDAAESFGEGCVTVVTDI